MASQYDDRENERARFGSRPEEYWQYMRGQQERGYEGQGRGYREQEERGYRDRGEGELRAQFGNEDYEGQRQQGRYDQGDRYGNYGNRERNSSGSSRGDYEQSGSRSGRDFGQSNQGGSRGYTGGQEYNRGAEENWTDFGGGRGYGGERSGERNRREEMGGYGESGHRENDFWSVRGPYTGHGPQGYKRSDERITEDVNERLTQHGHLDASMIQVKVKDGEVTLTGSVPDRQAKRMAEDIAESCSGVKEVQNQLRVNKENQTSGTRQNQAPTGQQGQSEMKRSAANK